MQSQVFVIVNDESYYYPDLMRGMIQDDAYGADLAMYTGSTTGTTRNNKICSSYAPITWHVDRKCQLISASAFDKMCADMSAQRDVSELLLLVRTSTFNSSQNSLLTVLISVHIVYGVHLINTLSFTGHERRSSCARRSGTCRQRLRGQQPG